MNGFFCSGFLRILAGYIGDLRYISRNGLAGAFCIFCGLLSVVSILFETFTSLMVYCVLFGIGAGLFLKYNVNFFQFKTESIINCIPKIPIS